MQLYMTLVEFYSIGLQELVQALFKLIPLDETYMGEK